MPGASSTQLFVVLGLIRQVEPMKQRTGEREHKTVRGTVLHI